MLSSRLASTTAAQVPPGLLASALHDTYVAAALVLLAGMVAVAAFGPSSQRL